MTPNLQLYLLSNSNAVSSAKSNEDEGQWRRQANFRWGGNEAWAIST